MGGFLEWKSTVVKLVIVATTDYGYFWNDTRSVTILTLEVQSVRSIDVRHL